MSAPSDKKSSSASSARRRRRSSRGSPRFGANIRELVFNRNPDLDDRNEVNNDDTNVDLEIILLGPRSSNIPNEPTSSTNKDERDDDQVDDKAGAKQVNSPQDNDDTGGASKSEAQPVSPRGKALETMEANYGSRNKNDSYIDYLDYF